MFGDAPSIADLSLGCEITNLEAIDYPLKEKFPSIYRWRYVEMASISLYKEIEDRGSKSFCKYIKSL